MSSRIPKELLTRIVQLKLFDESKDQGASSTVGWLLLVSSLAAIIVGFAMMLIGSSHPDGATMRQGIGMTVVALGASVGAAWHMGWPRRAANLLLALIACGAVLQCARVVIGN